MLVAVAAFAQEYDVRSVTWGMSMAEVAEAEKDSKALPSDMDHVLTYTSTMAGKEVLILYIFADDQLASATIAFPTQHEDKNLHLADYQEISTILNEKYGEQEIKPLWINKRFISDQKMYGFAVFAGDLLLGAEWKNDSESILHTMRGDLETVMHSVIYTSTEFGSKLADKKVEKKSSDGF